MGEAMLPKPVMKLRVATMLFLPSCLVLVEILGLHFSQPLCEKHGVTAEGYNQFLSPRHLLI